MTKIILGQQQLESLMKGTVTVLGVEVSLTPVALEWVQQKLERLDDLEADWERRRAEGTR